MSEAARTWAVGLTVDVPRRTTQVHKAAYGPWPMRVRCLPYTPPGTTPPGGPPRPEPIRPTA